MKAETQKPRKESSRKRRASHEFDVALSFSGENRKYVEEVAEHLREMDIKFFYDKFSEGILWGKDLYTYLDDIYRKRAKYTVIFISKAYESAMWTNHERRSAQSRALKENADYILPARFDKTEIPGILPTQHYIDLNKKTPAELAILIKEKIGPIPRENFFPRSPDELFKHLKIKNSRDRRVAEVIALEVFDMFKLMTFQERLLLLALASEACFAGKPNNLHVSLDYLCRETGLAREELLSMISRLDSLKLHTRVYSEHDDGADGALVQDRDFLELKYEPYITIDAHTDNRIVVDNATWILIAILDILRKSFCMGCRDEGIRQLDFSFLGSHTKRN